jgi:hypothetical protein
LRSVLLVLVLAAACSKPTYPEGLLCGEDGSCPPGQRCVADRCRSSSPDAAAEADGPPLPDTGVGADADLCGGGLCVETCEDAVASGTHFGCEFWPVDLDSLEEVLGPAGAPPNECSMGTAVAIAVCVNLTNETFYGTCDYDGDCSASPGTTCQVRAMCVFDAQHADFGIMVLNPGTQPTNVTLANGLGNSNTITLGPGDLYVFRPQSIAFPDLSLDHSGVTASAYRLTSQRPIAAWQFGPYEAAGMIYSADASLLLPSHAFGSSYVGVSEAGFVRRPGANDFNSTLTVVSTGPGTTTVTVTPSASVRAGAGVPVFPGGTTLMFLLDQYEVLNLEGAAGVDLTGTRITGTQPFAVYGGHEAAMVSPQDPPTCCADHLEEQLTPASSWGTSFAVGRTEPRAPATPDLVRIVAGTNGTQVTFDPPGPTCPVLQAGSHCDAFVNGDVHVVTTEPVQVAHYLTGNAGSEPTSADPAMSIVPPVDRFARRYVIAPHPDYSQNWATIVAPAAAEVTFDGTDLTPSLELFGSGAYKAVRMAIPLGSHTIECPSTCFVEVYGFGAYISYLYAGGMSLAAP